jgi:cytochrome P450
VTTTAPDIEYNPFDPNFYTTSPFEIYRWMRDEHPVYRSERWGWYALSRWDDVVGAALDWDTYRNFEGMDIDDTGDQTSAGNIAHMDNPRHDEVRRIVQPFFQPRKLQDEEHPIRQAVRSLVAKWDPNGQVDLASELAWPLPLTVFFNLLGLPTDQHSAQQLEAWSHALKDRVPGTPQLSDKAKDATIHIREFFRDQVRDRQVNPRDDLLTHIVQSEINGVAFADDRLDDTSEIVGLLILLFLGGFESTAGLIGTMFKLLAENPDQREILLNDPSLAQQAVEETLRWASPLQETARTAVKDVELHGVTIPAGSRVVLITGSANRDERQFPDADAFDLTRGKFRHLGFGEGLHRCLGAPLARLEARIVLEEVLPILGRYDLAAAPTFYPSSPNMYVWKNLPVRLGAPV